MTVKRDPDVILAAWLEEGPIRLPEATRRAIAVTTRTTHQGRHLFWVPRRFHNMNPSARLAVVVATVMVAAIGGLSLIGLTQPAGIGGPPLPMPNAGTVILTDSGCTWENKPAALTMPEILEIRFRNETEHHGVFILHWVKPEHTYAEGVDYIADIQRRLTTGEDWPTNDISLAVDEADVPAGDDTIHGWTTGGIGEGPLEEFRTGSNWRWRPGTYGIVCSANTSPTGDVLTTFLVGPLELMDVTTSPGPSASR